MKNEMKTTRWFVPSLVLGCVFAFTACDNDDDVTPPGGNVTTETVYSNYTGTMQSLSVSTNADENEGATEGTLNVSAEVANDTVHFAAFPIKDIVRSIVNDDAMADQIVEAVGDVPYKVGYEATLTAASDSIMMDMNPQSLALDVTIPSATEGEEAQPLHIEVKVSSVENGTYAVESSDLKFQLYVEEVLMGEGDAQTAVPGFNPTTLDFVMQKESK